MTSAVNNIAASVLGAQQAARQRAEETRRKEIPAASRVPQDEYQPTAAVDRGEADRVLKGNADEETHDDRVAHEGSAPLTGSRLDVRG